MTHVHYRHKRSRGKRLINRAGAEGHDPTFANSFARSIIICNLNLSDLPASLFWEHQIVESANWNLTLAGSAVKNWEWRHCCNMLLCDESARDVWLVTNGNTKIKSEIIRAIEDLPDDATVEDAMERLYFLAKIERGLEQSESGETISHAEIKARFLR